MPAAAASAPRAAGGASAWNAAGVRARGATPGRRWPRLPGRARWACGSRRPAGHESHAQRARPARRRPGRCARPRRSGCLDTVRRLSRRPRASSPGRRSSLVYARPRRCGRAASGGRRSGAQTRQCPRRAFACAQAERPRRP
ncbi:MAG: hypothetical protein DRH08_00015 [Deltaproteobacteria bacterium]|nr:MAG: hypothetical protein DRH08_00015 [Deltaproteobacteria bacterium]